MTDFLARHRETLVEAFQARGAPPVRTPVREVPNGVVAGKAIRGGIASIGDRTAYGGHHGRHRLRRIVWRGPVATTV